MMNAWRLLTLLGLLRGTTALPAAVESFARTCFYLSNPTSPQPTGWRAGRNINAGWVKIVYILYLLIFLLYFQISTVFCQLYAQDTDHSLLGEVAATRQHEQYSKWGDHQHDYHDPARSTCRGM